MPLIKIVPTGDIERAKKVHEQRMEESEEYKNALENITFKEGTKLLIEVEATDEYLSSNLHYLLFGKVEGAENLGFKLTAINFNNRDMQKEHFIKGVERLLEELKNGSY